MKTSSQEVYIDKCVKEDFLNYHLGEKILLMNICQTWRHEQLNKN